MYRQNVWHTASVIGASTLWAIAANSLFQVGVSPFELASSSAIIATVGLLVISLLFDPVPYLDETWINAKFTAPEAYTPELAVAIQLSDQLIISF